MKDGLNQLILYRRDFSVLHIFLPSFCFKLMLYGWLKFYGSTAAVCLLLHLLLVILTRDSEKRAFSEML